MTTSKATKLKMIFTIYMASGIDPPRSLLSSSSWPDTTFVQTMAFAYLHTYRMHKPWAMFNAGGRPIMVKFEYVSTNNKCNCSVAWICRKIRGQGQGQGQSGQAIKLFHAPRKISFTFHFDTSLSS